MFRLCRFYKPTGTPYPIYMSIVFRMFRLCRFFGNVRGGFVRAGSPGVGFVFLFSYPFKEEQEEQEEHRSRNKELVRSGLGTLVPLMAGLSVVSAANPEASSPVGDSVMLALDTLLSAAIDDDACVIDPAWGTAAAGPFRVSGEIAEFTALVEQPIGAAFRLALQRLGEHLAGVVECSEDLQDIAERAAERDRIRYGRRLAILESAWAEVMRTNFGMAREAQGR